MTAYSSLSKNTLPSLSNTEKNALPRIIELEESVLGALILERDAVNEVMDLLKPQHFSLDKHAIIFEAICQLFNQQKAIDPRTILEALRKSGQLERVGGPAYIVFLVDSVASARHLEDHVRIIVDYAMRRELIYFSKTLNKEAYENVIPTTALLEKGQKLFFDIASSHIKQPYQPIGTLIQEACKELELRKKTPEQVLGVSTGFPELDQFTLGWKKSDFIVIAARPSMGKTAFMLSLLRNAAVDHQAPVAFFSLEMSAAQLIERIIASETGVEGEKIKRASLAKNEWKKLYEKVEKLLEAPIYIDDTPALSLLEFRIKCRRLKMQKNIQAIFVDYLQLMVDDEHNQKNGNREQQVAAISRGIKAIAKELDIAIIVASQLSRAVETSGGDKRPLLFHIRESGSVEQDADMVIFPYRPEYYGMTQDETGRDARGLVEIIIAKNRHGRTGKVDLHFNADTLRFRPFGEDVFHSALSDPS